MRALFTTLGIALLATFLPLYALHQLHERMRERAQAEATQNAQQEAASARAALALDEAQRTREAAAQCQRDVGVERLGAEQAQGLLSQDALARTAHAIAKTTGKRVMLLAGSAGPTTLTAESRPLGRMLTRSELGRASETRVTLLAPEGLFFLASCRVSGRGTELWVALLEPVSAVVERLSLAAESPLAVRVADRATEPAAATAGVQVLALTDGAGQALGSIVSTARPPSTQPDAELATWALGFLIVGLLLGAFYAREWRARERALSELERAAERVAQGDLVSTIDVRLGDRADQTFGTFDRMTRELREMRERLRQSEREAAFRDVAQRIAHEIKNPLSPIRTGLETLRRARDKRLPQFDEIFEETTRVMLDEVRRIERIVREFVAFARLPEPKLGALDLVSLVRDVLALHRPEGASVTLELPAERTEVHADREQLTQVIINLLKNAAEATEGQSRRSVVLRLLKERERVVLHVDDSGPGIAPSERSKLFEPYFTTKDSGTGLGLSIVQRIVQDHGGTIEIADSPEGGARVTVKL